MDTNQIPLFDVTNAPDPRDVHGQCDIHSYDHYVVAFSGGRDSVACVLDLLEKGVPRRKIELMHHLVDGEPGTDGRAFDWPVTQSYIERFAEAFDIPLFFSWKNGGILREMKRDNALTAPMSFETPDGLLTSGGNRGSVATRRKFPAVSTNKTAQWCSSYTKISVGAAAIAAQTRFCNSRTAFITGERASESRSRAVLKTLEPHRTDRRNGRMARHVDHIRPILKWGDSDVWDIMQRWGVVPHPAYFLGYGRCSCSFCIFGSPANFATLREIDPQGFAHMVGVEQDLGHTMKHGYTLEQFADLGQVYEAVTPERAALAMSSVYTGDILVNPESWELPAGANGDQSGPG